VRESLSERVTAERAIKTSEHDSKRTPQVRDSKRQRQSKGGQGEGAQ